MSVLSVNNISKKYKQYFSQKARFLELLSGGRYKGHDEMWVLSAINFEVKAGESIGIIGENGAGKSTLLKIITGATQPTTGVVERQGRLSALLELGMGFDPEFSGQQNAIMGLQILGISTEKINQLIPAVIEFSELGDYFFKPLRTYSSGMQMRLAFSVATVVRPDILIVDEALSVGDAYFQHKCIKRIKEFKDSGTTFLFVSHAPEAVKSLCGRAIMLANGKIVKDSDSASVMNFYQSLMIKKEHDNEHVAVKTVLESKNESNNTSKVSKEETTLISEETIDYVKIELFNNKNQPIIHIVTGDYLRILITVAFKKAFDDVHVGIGIRTKHGIVVYEGNTYTLNQKVISKIESNTVLKVAFDMNFILAAGDYSIAFGVAESGYAEGSFKNILYREYCTKIITVIKSDTELWSGICNLSPRITVL